MVVGILVIILLVVGTMTVLASILCGVNPLWLTFEEIRSRVAEIAPYLAILALVYVFIRASHTVGQRLSAVIGIDITGELYALEGAFVAQLQSVVPYELSGYFSFVYLIGFTFMLVFPIVAYFALPSQRYLKELFIAYTINYGSGAVCYILFIAYGPRTVIATVQEPMFELFPEVTTVTAAVNSSANAFPSLHVSLTVTVWLLTWRTRDEYTLWTWIATVVVINVILSTMVIRIHWLIDVIAGIGLAVVSVAIALYFSNREYEETDHRSDAVSN